MISSLFINIYFCSNLRECEITVNIKCNANRKTVMDPLCLMSETADMRSFGEFMYSTDRYCCLLKKYNSVIAELFWMKRTIEISSALYYQII